MMTKNDERKALERIREIVNGLDDDGYVKVAMKGVLEDAESNIEFDFLLSYKDRYDSLSEKYEALYKKMIQTEAVISDLNEIIKIHKSHALKTNEGKMIVSALFDYRKYLSDDIHNLACDIVKYADEVDSDMFKESVKNHREAERKYSEVGALIEMINNKIN